MQFVMVVTRDLQLVKSIESALDSGWFKIWHLKNAREALAALGQQEPALIVCDGRVDIDAYIELTRKLKLDLGQSSMVFLLLTYADNPPEMALIRDAGVDDILKWPSPVAVLGNKLRQLIDKHESLSSRAATGETTIELGLRPSEPASTGFEVERGTPQLDRDPFVTGAPRGPIDAPSGFDRHDGVVFEHGFGTADGASLPKVSFGEDATPVGGLDAGVGIPQARLEELAARMLDQKLTEAARTQIKKVIVTSVQQELKRLMPQIVEAVRKEMGKS
ncbi:MAG: hypothetical protein IT350_21020 [Deltaproteobacteria bacterium]|nr:hypothetical protein [Deltaproteobacteria bacterium]